MIDGEIRITPPAKFIHAWTVSNVRNALVAYLDRPGFLVATAQFGLVIHKAPLTVRVPDLAMFEKDSILEQDGFIHSPPQLVAEVLAPGEDLTRKLADYASLGVPEVWVVSRKPAPSRSCSRMTAPSPHFPQVTVNVDDLWRDWRPQRVE